MITGGSARATNTREYPRTTGSAKAATKTGRSSIKSAKDTHARIRGVAATISGKSSEDEVLLVAEAGIFRHISRYTSVNN
ncbi:hypothetical protein L484_015164 [Morus notabilis]|uniref:Uncharacterized protein n=1 Tax=Morus notabilis TaxID=981085 RepID=W9S306_9ROSA|nr:hypothetical protein L484_015164 [Morus notabilis]